ncbi:MAG: helix-turn-helix transcriptional regulator [Pseudonocardiales bacterium]|nr:helix-turn-helix transcriptional regulator [Pseudonocardiales bacterium]MBV9730367.1 helix-turn-helix transcriptional regulator [Pseudonocardiales bacterium]
MHLVPAERAHHQAIDNHRVCDAIEALGEPEHLTAWAARFSLLGDRSRLALLLCIRTAGPISVTDLALAAGMHATTTSQALRLLRAAGAVTTAREGRIVRYQLADEALNVLLAAASPHQDASSN